ncbi:MAG: hypothetical protein R2822_16190 [Spirosomataceae bacterium]
MKATPHSQMIQHLFWRAGFGASPTELQAALSKSCAQVVKDLLRDSK